MTLLAPAAGENFTLRIYKRLNVSPTPVWANTYELNAQSVSTYGLLIAACERVVDYERRMHLSDVEFDRYVVSTHVPDGAPYDPSSFAVENISQPGLASPGSSQPLALNCALHLRRQTIFGRPGKLFYRRVLTETDVDAPAGSISLSTTGLTALTARHIAAVEDSGIDEDWTGGASFITHAMVAAGQPTRLVDQFEVVGALIVQFNNRYYDVP